MTIQLPSDLQAAVENEAARLGTTPQSLVEQTLRQTLARDAKPATTVEPNLQPADEWERRLLAIARPCGVSLPDEALSSEGLYD